MSRASFDAEFRAFKQRVEDKARSDYRAFVTAQDTALQIALAAVQDMARRHGVAPVKATGVNFQATKNPGYIIVIDVQ